MKEVISANTIQELYDELGRVIAKSDRLPVPKDLHFAKKQTIYIAVDTETDSQKSSVKVYIT